MRSLDCPCTNPFSETGSSLHFAIIFCMYPRFLFCFLVPLIVFNSNFGRPMMERVAQVPRSEFTTNLSRSKIIIHRMQWGGG